MAIPPLLLTEIRRVLGVKFELESAHLDDATTRLFRFTTNVIPTQTIDAVPSDPDDNRVLECAMESQSDYIVTGDNDLLRLVTYRNIRILKVADFLPLPSA